MSSSTQSDKERWGWLRVLVVAVVGGSVGAGGVAFQRWNKV